MAVSVLEAAAARTANQYLPVSRVRPARDIVELAGEAFCREHGIVPLWREGASVVVATAQPRAQDALRQLRERLGQSVVLRLSSPGEIRVAIDNALRIDARENRRAALADVLVAVRLLRPDQATAYAQAASDEELLGSVLVEAGLITALERIEALGLAFHLPHIDLRVHPPLRDLEALLDIATMRALHVLPVWTTPGELFVACDTPPTAETMEQLDAALGMLIRPVLVAPADLAERLAALADDDMATGTELAEAVRRERIAPAAQIEAAERVARQTEEPFPRALQRLAGVTPEAMQEALARTSGLRVFRDDQTPTDVTVALSPTIARRLQAVPISRDGRRVIVAMANPWDRRARRGLGALFDAEIQPAIADDAAIARLLEGVAAAPPIKPAPPGSPSRTAAILVQAGFVDTTLSALVDIDLNHVNEDTLPRLWQVMDERLRSDAVTLDACTPLIDVLLWHPDPEAAAVRQSGIHEQPLLPILCQAEILTVAIASPDAIESARLLASAHQRGIRVAIAREDYLSRAIDDLGTLDLRTIGPAYVTLGRVLERRHGIARRDVITLFRRMRELSEPLDVAAVRLQMMTAEQFAGVLGEATSTTALVLSRDDRLETTINAEGIPVTRRALHDPLDHEVSRLLTAEDARRLGALPVRRDGNAVVVGMADPLDAASVAVLGERIGAPLRIHPTTRADVMEAVLRVNGRAALGDQLLESGLITRAQMREALEIVDRTGVRMGEALISLGIISEDELGEALARQRGMPFYAVRGLDLDPAVLQLLPEEFARQYGMVPIMVEEDGTVVVAMDDPNNTVAMTRAKDILGREVSFAMTTRTDIRDALERLYHDSYLEHSATSLMMSSPEESAYIVATRAQKTFLIGLSATIIVSLIFWTIGTLTVLLALATTFYLAFSSYKFYLIYRALSHTLEVPITDEMVRALEDRDLPIYTILIPLYRETEVLPILVKGLSRMDYPKEKMDVKLLLEEDDVETIAVARLSNLPPYFDITIVPDGQPKGKPKACNYGLLHARGKFVVIFDAEDIPEPDQLKKVLVAFSMSEPNVVCVQTKLNYYNRNQNVLTRWFTTEYSTWFDLFLPGLDASGAPIPLGGTSNHFRLDALQSVGGWDPFNVTEDADLGLRIFKLGGRTVVVDSTTYEEANSVLDNWIRQRSRWVKGYIQTYLVHMRHPLGLLRALGLGGFISFQVVIGGTFFGFLLNPLLWGLTAVWFATHWAIIQEVFPAPVYYMGAISLYAGNFAFAYMNVAGCLRRRYYSLVKWALLSPVYWVLMSIAAWKGFLQLFYKPFYWEKTVHGLANASSVDDLIKLTSTESS